MMLVRFATQRSPMDQTKFLSLKRRETIRVLGHARSAYDLAHVYHAQAINKIQLGDRLILKSMCWTRLMKLDIPPGLRTKRNSITGVTPIGSRRSEDEPQPSQVDY